MKSARISALILLASCSPDREFAPGESSAGAAGMAGAAGGAGQEGTGGAGTGGAGAGGAAGQGGTPDCLRDEECPSPSSECSLAKCEDGRCAVVHRAAEAPCTEGVCSGTGTCGECVPGQGTCDGQTPRVCSDEGVWTTEPDCATGDACSAGRCLAPTLDWYLQTGGTGAAWLTDVGLDRSGNVYVAGDFARTLEFGGRTLTQPPDVFGRDVAIARVPADGSGAVFLNQIGSDQDETLPILSVAPNGNHYVGLQYHATLVRGGPAHQNVNTQGEAYTMVAGYAANGVYRGGNAFKEPETNSAAKTNLSHSLLATADGSGAYAVVDFDFGVSWLTSGSPPYGSLTSDDCDMLLVELAADGPAKWHAQHRWCAAGNQKYMARGGDGSLYIGSVARGRAAGPATQLGSVTVDSNSSALLAKFDPTNGSAIRVREMPCSSYGQVEDLVATPSGDLLALVRCRNEAAAELIVGDRRLSGSDMYLIQFDTDLNPVAHVGLGRGTLFEGGALAVNPKGDVFVVGTIAGAFDFGAGEHAYAGTCYRCSPGDAFVAAYDSALRLRFSRTFGSGYPDRGFGVAATDERLYVTFLFGDTLDLEGEVLNPPPEQDESSVLVSFELP